MVARWRLLPFGTAMDGLFLGAILASRYCLLNVLPTNFLTRLLWTDWKVLPVLFGMWNSFNIEGQLTKSYQVWYSFRTCQINGYFRISTHIFLFFKCMSSIVMSDKYRSLWKSISHFFQGKIHVTTRSCYNKNTPVNTWDGAETL